MRQLSQGAASALRVRIDAKDPLVRAGLAGLLAQQSGLELVSEDADVVLWDAGESEAPFASGLPTLALLPESAEPSELLALGVLGLLPRDVSGERLATALEALAEGLLVIDPLWLERLAPRRDDAEPQREQLTPRETQTLALLAEGLSNRAIAERLGISEHTAKFHVNAVLAKLGVERRVQAVVRAARLGILEL